MELVLIAVSLAMDAVAVATAIGASERALRPVLVAAALFGVFQAGMSGLGWLGGAAVQAYAAAWDHWVAFVLLGGIGGQMLRGGGDDDEAPARGLIALVGLALATSIDALVAGVTLPMLEVPGLVAVGVIGAVTAVLSVTGGVVGSRVGAQLGPRLEKVAGLALIGLGLKVLISHLLGGGI